MPPPPWQSKSRRVPIEDPDRIAHLERLRKARARGRSPEAAVGLSVFVGPRYNRLSRTSFYWLLHFVLAAADLASTGITPHALRHTFGSMLCASGVPVPYVKDLLGHEDIGSTMIYVHSSPSALRDAVRKLAE